MITRTGLSCHELHDAKPLTVTIKRAREITGLGNTTLWKLIKDGQLKTISVGRRRLLVFSSLEAMVNVSSSTV